GRRPDAGDLRGDRVRLLVDVVVELRADEPPRRDAQQVRAEGGRDDDGGVVVAGPHPAQRRVLPDEPPAQLVVRLELVDDLGADVDLARYLRRRTLVEVDDRDLDVLRVRVRVPEREDVHPRVHGRHDDEPDDDGPDLRRVEDPPDVAAEHLQGVAHRSSSSPAVRGAHSDVAWSPPGHWCSLTTDTAFPWCTGSFLGASVCLGPPENSRPTRDGAQRSPGTSPWHPPPAPASCLRQGTG